MSNNPPFDLGNLGSLINKVAVDAKKNMEKWWHPTSHPGAIESASAVRQFLTANFIDYALKKNKSIFRIVYDCSFYSKNDRDEFINNLGGKIFFTEYVPYWASYSRGAAGLMSNIHKMIIIYDQALVYLEISQLKSQGSSQELETETVEFHVMSYDPKFIPTKFNKTLFK